MTSFERALTPNIRRKFRKRLLTWYDAHKRDLPWRRDREPYRVWLSEIMLQQTRVVAVLEHYRRFLKRFPTVERLAAAREASVLALWSGLGYYRRARMLHAAAKEIVTDHSGEFPETAAELRQLPGIGRYTSAAIASIAFDEAIAVVDGNVERVMERMRGRTLAVEEMWREAEELLDRSRPGDHNQAMMELGATICLPRQPKCLACPIIEMCVTRGELQKPARKSRQKKREICYTLDCSKGAVFMVQRAPNASLMAGMWELPESAAVDAACLNSFTLRHSITVTDYAVRIQRESAEKLPGEWISKVQLKTIPLTGLARKILRTAEII